MAPPFAPFTLRGWESWATRRCPGEGRDRGRASEHGRETSVTSCCGGEGEGQTAGQALARAGKAPLPRRRGRRAGRGARAGTGVERGRRMRAPLRAPRGRAVAAQGSVAAGEGPTDGPAGALRPPVARLSAGGSSAAGAQAPPLRAGNPRWPDRRLRRAGPRQEPRRCAGHGPEGEGSSGGERSWQGSREHRWQKEQGMARMERGNVRSGCAEFRFSSTVAEAPQPGKLPLSARTARASSL